MKVSEGVVLATARAIECDSAFHVLSLSRVAAEARSVALEAHGVALEAL